MLPTMAGTEPHLRLFKDIVYAVDPLLAQHLRQTEPFFALAATLTLYAHEIEEYGDIARLFDFLLANEASMSLYLYAAVRILHDGSLTKVLTKSADRHLPKRRASRNGSRRTRNALPHPVKTAEAIEPRKPHPARIGNILPLPTREVAGPSLASDFGVQRLEDYARCPTATRQTKPDRRRAHVQKASCRIQASGGLESADIAYPKACSEVQAAGDLHRYGSVCRCCGAITQTWRVWVLIGCLDAVASEPTTKDDRYANDFAWSAIAIPARTTT